MKGTGLVFAACTLLNLLSIFSYVGTPLKFLYFLKFPLAIIIAFELHSQYSTFILFLLILEAIFLCTVIFRNRYEFLVKNIMGAVEYINTVPYNIIAYGKFYYPLFYYCGDKVTRKRWAEENSPLKYLHLREKNSEKLRKERIEIIYENGEVVIYRSLA